MLRDALAAPPARRGVDVVTYSAAIAACRNGGEWKQALSLMEVTVVFRVAPCSKRRQAAQRVGCSTRENDVFRFRVWPAFAALGRQRTKTRPLLTLVVCEA